MLRLLLVLLLLLLLWQTPSPLCYGWGNKRSLGSQDYWDENIIDRMNQRRKCLVWQLKIFQTIFEQFLLKSSWSRSESMFDTLSSPHGALAFDKFRRYHARPSQFNWGSKNLHFGDLNIDVRVLFFSSKNDQAQFFIFCIFHYGT